MGAPSYRPHLSCPTERLEPNRIQCGTFSLHLVYGTPVSTLSLSQDGAPLRLALCSPLFSVALESLSCRGCHASIIGVPLPRTRRSSSFTENLVAISEFFRPRLVHLEPFKIGVSSPITPQEVTTPHDRELGSAVQIRSYSPKAACPRRVEFGQIVSPTPNDAALMACLARIARSSSCQILGPCEPVGAAPSSQSKSQPSSGCA